MAVAPQEHPKGRYKLCMGTGGRLLPCAPHEGNPSEVGQNTSGHVISLVLQLEKL